MSVLTFALVALLVRTTHVAEPHRADDPPNRFGGFLSEIRGLHDPASVVVTPDDEVVVVESLTSKIRVFDAKGTELRSFGARGTKPGELLEPQGLALSPDDEIHVSDTLNDRIQVFSKDGQFLRTIGIRGTGASEFNTPLGLAVDKDRIWVADSRNHRVQVFLRDGRFVNTIGRFGHGDGELDHPSDVAVDADWNAYVADTDNHRIQVFDRRGDFVRSFGGHGPYSGLFLTPSGIRYHDGRVYVADRDNHRVQVYDVKGELLYEWGVHALRPHESRGKVHYVNQVAIAPSGKFAAVVEAFEDRLQLFGAETSESAIAQRSQEKNTGSHYGVAADSEGATMVLLEPSAPALLVWDVSTAEPVEVSRFGIFGQRAGQLVRPEGVALDAAGANAYVADPGLGRLSVFRVARPPNTELGYIPELVRFVKSVDFNVLAEEERAAPSDSATPPSPRESGAKRPPPLAHAPAPSEAKAPWPIEPGAVKVDARGDVWLIDAANRRVVVLDKKLVLARSFGGARVASLGADAPRSGATQGAGASESADASASTAASERARDVAPSRPIDATFLHPTDLALSPSGEVVYVVDAAACSVSAFDRDGIVLFAFGTRGDGPTDFVRPFGIAVAPDATVFVTDEAGDKVVKFDAVGRPLGSFGRKGLGRVEFFKPKGICLNADGHLVVVDWGNHRGQVIGTDGNFVTAFGARLFIQGALKGP